MSVRLRPYPAYEAAQDAWLPEQPKSWRHTRIKNLLRESDERTGATVRTLLSLSRSRGLVPHDDLTARVARPDDFSAYKVCRPGDLVMNRMQAWSGMFADADREGVVSPEYAIFRAHPGADVRFMRYLFKTLLYVEQFAARSKGIGTGFNRLYSEDFGAIPVAVPTADEQRQIAAFLTQMDRRINRLIGAKRRLIALLEEQKQAVIQHAVTRGLDPNVRLRASGVAWLGDVPEGWEVRALGRIAKVGNGSTPSRGNAAYWAPHGLPWLNSSTVHQGRISKVEQFVTDLALRECHLPQLQPGAVLVAITGQGRTRGRAALLGVPATINQHIAYIEIRAPGISPEYLRLYLLGAYNELRAISDDSGSTKGALTCSSLRRFKVAVPPPAEQFELLRTVHEQESQLDVMTAAAERQIDLLREYRTRLIADVVTGKLDVRGAALAPLAAGAPGEPDDAGEIELEDAGDDAAEEPNEPEGGTAGL